MADTLAEQDTTTTAIDASLMRRVFVVFAGLALLSLAISVGGRQFGQSIAMAGHTDDRGVHEIVIGNNVIAAPANAIRFEAARRDGIAERVELYLRWPDMDGYSEAARDDFNHARGSRRILFLSFSERIMSRDMSGRFEPIYRRLIAQPGTAGPAGVTLFDFADKSGYLNEVLAVAPVAGGEPFVARCLSGPAAAESLAPCERDVDVGDGLSLSYRFPRELLGEWKALDAAMRGKAGTLIRTAP